MLCGGGGGGDGGGGDGGGERRWMMATYSTCVLHAVAQYCKDKLGWEKKLSSRTRAPLGCRHSPAPMLRVGQGSTSTYLIQYLTESKNRYYETHSVRV